MKNLIVNLSGNIPLKKRMIHNSVAFLKNELKFKINELIINIINKEEIVKINSEYLNHNYSTDIITFDYSETNSGLDGEIYISYEDALGNSAKYGSLPEEETVRLVTHGILHMLGYNDQKKAEQTEMKKLENELVIKQKSIWIC